ncbi:MAG TPA: hypothetical protein VH186_11035 [Chloroflexia bacterium]|nr:hypothetical protein [Chloroflexia bacterium]
MDDRVNAVLLKATEASSNVTASALVVKEEYLLSPVGFDLEG